MRAKNGKLQSRTTNSWNSPRGKGKKNIGKTWKSKICEMGNSRWPSVLKDTKD